MQIISKCNSLRIEFFSYIKMLLLHWICNKLLARYLSSSDNHHVSLHFLTLTDTLEVQIIDEHQSITNGWIISDGHGKVQHSILLPALMPNVVKI